MIVIDMTSKKDEVNSSTVELKENKLILSDSAINSLSVIPGDRLHICYVQDADSSYYPVIGKSQLFGDPDLGSKITKSKTISFRGAQNECLKRYGDLFVLIPDNKIIGTFKMKSINNNNLK